MDLNALPKRLKEEAKIHMLDGYEITSFIDGVLKLTKKKPIKVGMIIINILTLRWVVYAWLPNILVGDLFRIKYHLFLKEEDKGVVVTTG